MWDLVPWPEIEPRPPALGAQSLSHETIRDVPRLLLNNVLPCGLLWDGTEGNQTVLHCHNIKHRGWNERPGLGTLFPELVLWDSANQPTAQSTHPAQVNMQSGSVGVGRGDVLCPEYSMSTCPLHAHQMEWRVINSNLVLKTSVIVWTWLSWHLILLRKPCPGTSLVVLWSRLCPSCTGGMGSIPGWGTKMLHAIERPQIKNNKKSQVPTGRAN